MDIIRAIEQQQIKQDLPEFHVGDNVKVHYRITEGNRERIQVFQGDVIRRQGESVRETFTVRKISFSIGVERTFPVHSPKIEKIEVTRKGDVRRAKPVSYTHLRAHETELHLVCRLLLEKNFFFNDTATTEIYTLHIVGSVGCV